MSDVFDKEGRSRVMSQVRSKGNQSTELRMIKLFKENGITGWRRNYLVTGHPDFVFLNRKVAIFVDGCFWHGHDCRNTRPKENADYWQNKRENNVRRDAEVTRIFKERGWQVVRIWECQLTKAKAPNVVSLINTLLYEC